MTVLIAPIPRDIRDRVGEAMRLAMHGVNILPAWNDLQDVRREHWRRKADSMLATMWTSGLGIREKSGV